MGKSSVVTQTVANPADQRVQLETQGAGSMFISPGATVAQPGAVAGSVGSYSQLTQNQQTTVTGLTSDQVRQMLLDQEVSAQESVKQVAQLSSSALATSTEAMKTLATAKTGETTDWTKYIPFLVVGVIAVAMLSGRGRIAA